MFSALTPGGFAIAADLAFPVVLVAVVAREFVAGKNWRNVPMTAPITVLGIGNLFMHLESAGSAVSAGLGWRIALGGVVALISVVGGRIIPSFTRNWLMKRRAKQLPAAHGWIDRGALGFLHAGLLAWAILPEFEPIGWILLAASGMNCWRLFRWRGLATVGESLVAVLHLG